MAAARSPCVFLDRDGTLIRHVPYLCDPARVELLPTVVEGIDILIDAGARLILHTNQSGIGRGYFTAEQAEVCTTEMLRQISRGALFSDVCMSPDVPGGKTIYRKPAPRFAREVLAKYSLDASDAYYLGDSLSDLLTAKNVGGTGVGVSSGLRNLRDDLARDGLKEAFVVFDFFADAARHIAARYRS
jgi:D-glycero-D-manno-heptose 1,7-bisphosphate phosphatase